MAFDTVHGHHTTIWSERHKYSRPRSLRGFRLGYAERLEAKVVCAVSAEHDSVGHLLESRCAGATSKVFEALRERACRSIEDADVIEREVLAGLAAPLDSCLLSVHNKLGNSHSLIYSRLEDLAATVREYCRLGPGRVPRRRSIQHFPAAHAELSSALKGLFRRLARCYSAFLSATCACNCLPVLGLWASGRVRYKSPRKAIGPDIGCSLAEKKREECEHSTTGKTMAKVPSPMLRPARKSNRTRPLPAERWRADLTFQRET